MADYLRTCGSVPYDGTIRIFVNASNRHDSARECGVICPEGMPQGTDAGDIGSVGRSINELRRTLRYKPRGFLLFRAGSAPDALSLRGAAV